MNKIVVIGSCNMDVVVLADKRPGAGETVLGKSLHISPGGKGANQAVAAAKLGAQVTMIGAVGSDDYGRQMLKILQNHGINTDHIAIRDQVPTGTAHITLAEGDNSIIVLLGANATVDKQLIDTSWSAIQEADLVLLQNEIPLDTIGYVTQQCAQAKIPVLVNPAPAAPLKPEWLEAATFITPNEHELSALYPGQNAKAVMMANPEKIIVTLGKQGVAYASQKRIERVPGFIVEPVDTTGAGDTFNGAFAKAIANGQSIRDSITYGNAAAALSIQKLGAQEGMPNHAQVTAFLREQTQNTNN